MVKVLIYDALCNLVHLYNLKNVKNTHGGALLLLKVYHSSMGVFLNGTKPHKASQETWHWKLTAFYRALETCGGIR